MYNILILMNEECMSGSHKVEGLLSLTTLMVKQNKGISMYAFPKLLRRKIETGTSGPAAKVVTTCHTIILSKDLRLLKLYSAVNNFTHYLGYFWQWT